MKVLIVRTGFDIRGVSRSCGQTSSFPSVGVSVFSHVVQRGFGYSGKKLFYVFLQHLMIDWQKVEMMTHSHQYYDEIKNRP